MAASCMLKLLIVLTIADICYSMDSHSYKAEINKNYKDALERRKNIACREPDWKTCRCTFFLTKNKIVRWFFYKEEGACWPLRFVDDQNSDISFDVLDLPKTKTECEDLCGQNCTVENNNGTTQKGVCMVRQYCDIPVPVEVKYGGGRGIFMVSKPNPCSPYDIPCCPRNYQIGTHN